MIPSNLKGYHFLSPAKYNLKYGNSKTSRGDPALMSIKHFSIREQLMVTLMRLRRGWDIFTPAHTAAVNLLSAKYLRHGSSLMFNRFKDNLVFPSQNELKKVFKPFKNICASIDYTEFKCEVLRDYGQQGNCYSSFEPHSTMKCLIAVTPHGAACFVLDLREGDIEDITIFDQCGIIDHVNEGDAFLVDRCFTCYVTKQQFPFHRS